MSMPSLNGWWQELACPLRDASVGGDDSDLEPLAELFADARVVGLGESSHGASELFTMKHRLIEFLITRFHFSVVAFEAGFSGGAVIDDYVRSSKGNLAAALTGQGYTAWDTEEVSDLLHWLHDHNADLPEDRRVRFWGLDSGYNTNGREQILRYLNHTAPEQAAAINPTFDRLKQLEARWPFLLHDAASDLAAAHTELRRLFQVLARTNPGDPAALQATRYLQQMLWWTGPDRDARSRHMATTLQELIDAEPSDRKVVVWAHNVHVGRGSGSDFNDATLGDILSERFETDYVAVSLEFGTGQCHQRSLGADLTSGDLVVQDAGSPPVDSLPWCLAGTGAPALAVMLRDRPPNPAADAWLAEPRTEHAIGWTSADWATYDTRSPIADKYDAIVYVDTITPTHPTRNAIHTIANHERY